MSESGWRERLAVYADSLGILSVVLPVLVGLLAVVTGLLEGVQVFWIVVGTPVAALATLIVVQSVTLWWARGSAERLYWHLVDNPKGVLLAVHPTESRSWKPYFWSASRSERELLGNARKLLELGRARSVTKVRADTG
jgi:hypothetical protein